MANNAMQVLLMTSAIGEYFADNSFPKAAGEKETLLFFQSIIDEYTESFKLKNSELNQMTSDISNYFDGVTNDKNDLIAKEGADAVAEAAAGAATIAAACGSWVPLVNFGLAAAAVTATVIALGLEIHTENLEKSVLHEISNANNNIVNKYDSFKGIKAFQDAVNHNNYFFPLLGLTASYEKLRAMFIGVVIYIKKANKGKCTPDMMKKYFIDFYNASQADPNLVKDYSNVL